MKTNSHYLFQFSWCSVMKSSFQSIVYTDDFQMFKGTHIKEYPVSLWMSQLSGCLWMWAAYSFPVRWGSSPIPYLRLNLQYKEGSKIKKLPTAYNSSDTDSE